ncbi:hypothetical protein BH18ACT11_BH18ACT11_23160 [soil metagenome]
MNVLNRLIMILIALLLVAVPVLLLLVAFGVIPPDQADRYTDYRAAVGVLGGLSTSSLATTGARVTLSAGGAVLALLALLLLLRELTFGRRIARSAVIEDEPGRETRIKSGAAKALAEGAAREAGAVSPSVSLATEKRGAYRIFCDVLVPEGVGATGLTTRVRQNVLETVERQGVPARDAEVTMRGVES